MTSIDGASRSEINALLAMPCQPLSVPTREPVAAAIEEIGRQYASSATASDFTSRTIARQAIGKLLQAAAVGVRNDGLVQPAIIGLVATLLPEARSKNAL